MSSAVCRAVTDYGGDGFSFIPGTTSMSRFFFGLRFRTFGFVLCIM
jgi:hypothetical protein